MSCLLAGTKNRLGPKLFIIYDQLLIFNLCKTYNLYAHFSAEHWEFKIEINQICKFSNVAHSTKFISFDRR